MTFHWTEEVEEEILTRIMRGESVVQMLGPARDDFLPSETTFYKRLASETDFAERYAHAREAQAHREVDEIRQIADTATNEDFQVARLKIDARKWRAVKLAPKKYGDKLDMHHTGDLNINVADSFVD